MIRSPIFGFWLELDAPLSVMTISGSVEACGSDSVAGGVAPLRKSPKIKIGRLSATRLATLEKKKKLFGMVLCSFHG